MRIHPCGKGQCGTVVWANAKAKAKAAGCMINEISDKVPFQKAANPVWKKYGPKYQDMINRILALA